jgi:hypothetical protein
MLASKFGMNESSVPEYMPHKLFARLLAAAEIASEFDG